MFYRMLKRFKLLSAITIFIFISPCYASDITPNVFGNNKNGIPAAFGDFNSDDLTDIFFIKENRVEILLNSNEGEPLLQDSKIGCNFSCNVLSVVPGDFNGDALMDILVTTKCKDSPHNSLTVLWGNINSINCSEEVLLKTRGEPLALDFNNDFITDLYGEEMDGARKFWVFKSDKTIETVHAHRHCGNKEMPKMREPHSNAYLDLNNDYIDDIFVTSGKGDQNQVFEFWYGTNDPDNMFICDTILLPPNVSSPILKMGQSLFLDVELKGKLDHILPLLTSTESKLYVYSNATDKWHDTKVDLTDPSGISWQWGWDKDVPLLHGITIRGCDFNMDGYPDLIAPLVSPSGASQTVLLENVPCDNCHNFTRTFKITWHAFYPNANDSVTGAFFDIFQDGVMDVILVYKKGDAFSLGAIKNNLDYDANFVKVMVLSGLQNSNFSYVDTPLGQKKRTFGSNLPGPRIWYRTLDQEGNFRIGMSAQIPQSAHFALNLPYTTFALGRTPNFVDALTVGFANKYREWPQLIPNSQMVVIPNPVDTPSRWKVKLFVTPSKVILVSGATLCGLIAFILLIIGFLEYKERRTDRIERNHSLLFYFDAM